MQCRREYFSRRLSQQRARAQLNRQREQGFNNSHPTGRPPNSGSDGTGADDGEEEPEPLELVVPTPLTAGLGGGNPSTLEREDAFRIATTTVDGQDCPFCGKRPTESPVCSCEKSFESAFGTPLRDNAHARDWFGGQHIPRQESIAWVCDSARSALHDDEEFQKYLTSGVVVVRVPSCDEH